MKKLFALAAALLIGSLLFVPDSWGKKKKEKTSVAEQPVTLSSQTDSVSYAAGIMIHQGLIPFLKMRFGVDTAYMADFLKGYDQQIKSGGDARATAYAAGLEIGKQITTQMLPRFVSDFKDSPDSINADLFHRGFRDALRGDSTVFSVSDGAKYFQEKQESDQKAKSEKLYGDNRRAGEAFLAENKGKDSVQVTESGLQYKIITAGSGETPKKTDKVKVRYRGTLIDGTEFDSSFKRKDSINTFRADQVIKGWTEALTMMPVGSHWILYIPQELGYGDREAGKIKPFSALIFDVTLVGIEGQKKADPAAQNSPATPSAVKKKSAAKTSEAKKKRK